MSWILSVVVKFSWSTVAVFLLVLVQKITRSRSLTDKFNMLTGCIISADQPDNDLRGYVSSSSKKSGI